MDRCSAIGPQEAADLLWEHWVRAAVLEIEANAGVRLERPGKAFDVSTQPVASLARASQLAQKPPEG